MEDARMLELIDILTRANRAYEQESREIMTDFEYDALYDELAALEAKSGVVLENSPTLRVGHEIVSSLQKVRHDTVMLSLDKTKDVAKLETFLHPADGPVAGVLSWKLDGLSLVLKYAQGRLAAAITRGNGQIGEDVTHNARFIRNIPKEIDFMGSLTLRGEAIISFSEFARINEALPADEKYKNPRNLCAGTMRQLDTRVAATRKVEYYPFSLVAGPDFALKSQGLAFLKQQGFAVAEYHLVDSENVADAVEYFKDAVAARDFATDGLVLTFDDVAYSESLGATSKFPRDSVAFKWADEQKRTRLLDIQWSPSRTGLINPIAIFEAVEIEGTTVERASLHNISILEGLSLGVGDEISVYKANMIIPQIAENFTKSGPAGPPDACPACGGPTAIKDENGTRTLHCINDTCVAKLVHTITHYASRDALNIEGFSRQTVEKFIRLGFLKSYADIYRLESHAEEIMALKGFGEKSFNKLVDAIEKSKQANLANFIFGLGIDNVGLSGAKLLCRHFDHNLDAIRHAPAEDFADIEGFGDIIAQSLHNYFRNEDNTAILDAALPFLSFIKEETLTADADSPIFGKTFVITGDLVRYKNRKELQNLIEARGGKVSASVSAKTDYLINNNVLSASAKNKKARELGVAIITEEDFINFSDL
ncbi:MAG: NAD-dependent DNA ligase LigA [Clostridiales bacterium]|jgi:DNA ligase (NAD+)|nr:NAD-dependent DNA ligase LigA [Clostridiales bacterium]